MTGQGGPPSPAVGRDADRAVAREKGHDRAASHGHGPNSVPAPWAKRILWGLFVLCAALALLDVPALIRHWRHEEHPWEALPMLYPLWGFAGISVLILLSKGLRRLVMRPEHYYEGRGAGGGDARAGDAAAYDAEAYAEAYAAGAGNAGADAPEAEAYAEAYDTGSGNAGADAPEAEGADSAGGDASRA